MSIERVYPGRKASAIALLAVASALSGATQALAQNLPTERDLVGIWDVKDKKTNTKLGTIELMETGQFEMVVVNGNTTTRYPATPKARWELNGQNFRVVYDPDGRGKQVYMRGRIDTWTKNSTGTFFELPLREVNRWPVKEGVVLILEQ